MKRKRLKVLRKKQRPRVFTAKQTAHLAKANSHLRKHICLTPKQVSQLISALRSAAEHRSTESEREYFRQILNTIKEQTIA